MGKYFIVGGTGPVGIIFLVLSLACLMIRCAADAEKREKKEQLKKELEKMAKEAETSVV